MSQHLEKARKAWGEDLPDWVAALAQACDATSQNKAAKAIGYSAAVVSYVIGRAYAGDMARVETRVRAALMGGLVACPQLGEIELSQCLEWRGRAAAFTPTSTVRREMYQACNACPKNGGDHAE